MNTLKWTVNSCEWHCLLVSDVWYANNGAHALLVGYPQISAAKAHGLPAYRLASAGQELSSVMLGLQVRTLAGYYKVSAPPPACLPGYSTRGTLHHVSWWPLPPLVFSYLNNRRPGSCCHCQSPSG
jgi:hypothetical protein